MAEKKPEAKRIKAVIRDLGPEAGKSMSAEDMKKIAGGKTISCPGTCDSLKVIIVQAKKKPTTLTVVIPQMP